MSERVSDEQVQYYASLPEGQVRLMAAELLVLRGIVRDLALVSEVLTPVDVADIWRRIFEWQEADA